MYKLNRFISPAGDFIVPQSKNGAWMGNRGELRIVDGEITGTLWAGSRWIYCTTEEGSDGPNTCKYTKLFFLDEATALAAGHRPCWDCLRDEFYKFKTAWFKGNSYRNLGDKETVAIMDRELDKERINKDRTGKGTFTTNLRNLHDGVMVRRDNQSWLIWQGTLWLWAPDGYSQPSSIDSDFEVEVLTPKSTCNAFSSGYKPSVALKFLPMT